MTNSSKTPPRIIGHSPQMQDISRIIARVGPTAKPILIQGESGTGKELVARALHAASPLADKPLVVVNSAVVPEMLLESELFGYEKGAFSGATGTKPGLFEAADGGTLFINEIGELAPSLQARLLRVLKDGTLRRVGSLKERRVRVRLLAATKRDLQQEIEAKRFREDLFYQINVLTIQLPPLRARRGDLPELVRYFAGPAWRVEPEVIRAIEGYSWPGNVRQLQNAIERTKILAEDDRIRVENLPPEIIETAESLSQNRLRRGRPSPSGWCPAHFAPTTPHDHRRDGARPVPDGTGIGSELRPRAALDSEADLFAYTRRHILETYHRHRRNKSETARVLGISRRMLYRLLDKYGAVEACKQQVHKAMSPK